MARLVAGPGRIGQVPGRAQPEARNLLKSPHFENQNRAMNDTLEFPPLPDHLSVDPRSPHHVPAVLEHEIGIRLNDQERKDVEEYCISEGWVKVQAGKAVDRRGRPLLIKLKGKVEAYYR